MEENRRNPKYGKEHWADSKARTQKSCYSEDGVPLRSQWTLMLITRCVGECREVATNTKTRNSQGHTPLLCQIT